MHTSSTIHFGRPRVLISATLCSLFLAACGGGGGSGGNGGTGMTSEQQTALAAKTAAGTAQFAQSFAQSQTESSDETGGGTSAQTSGQATTQGSTDQDCTQGRLVAYDNSDGINETDLDIGTADFPALFTNSVSEGDGTVDYYQTRSNCVDENFVIDGSADISALQIDPGKTALAYRAGAFQGDQPEDGVDTTGSLDIEFSFSGATSDISVRGVIHACNSCVDANLNAFDGTTDLDTAASAWLEMSLDFGEGPSVFELGNDVDDRFTLVSSADAPGTAAVDINGRLAVDNPGDECDFDVTYATNESVVIENFDTTENQMTTGGDLDITNNATGETFNVTYDTDGNVNVNGERVDVSDQEDACTLSTEEA